MLGGWWVMNTAQSIPSTTAHDLNLTLVLLEGYFPPHDLT